ncbi:14.7 kDa ribonuclease H-like protein [Juglans microcarpa x Juglans regia]|uniref:14.7 kDa ribonuclease H-like protein n=1 Tax=Juglans microcarpa x Juglans regia TaxID=2249226 RepID=UPI001B7E0262|nr:14.7 kDa ribonuclease H-like protein [Juglans microcarpa x Juglans regia]
MSSKIKHFWCQGPLDRVILDELGCSIIPIVTRKVELIAWRPPERGQVKLNVDGGSCGNPGISGGGGIIRDDQGGVVAGFAHNYGHATNTIAECRALLDGLRLCRQLGLRDVLVESDSMVIVGWFLWKFWEEITTMVGELNVRFRHIFRELIWQ